MSYARHTRRSLGQTAPQTAPTAPTTRLTTPTVTQPSEFWWLDPTPALRQGADVLRNPGMLIYVFASPIGWAYVIGSLAIGYGVYRKTRSKVGGVAGTGAALLSMPYLSQVGRGAWNWYDQRYGRTAQWTQQRTAALATAPLATHNADGSYSCPGGNAISMRRNADGTTERVCMPTMLAA